MIKPATFQKNLLFCSICTKDVTDFDPIKITKRPNKKISVFRVTGLKNLGTVGTHIFFPFKMHKIIFFPENLKKFRFHQ